MTNGRKKYLESLCDGLVKQIAIIKQHSRCEQCGRRVLENECDPHHIIPRGRKATRWDPNNISILHRVCPGMYPLGHRYFTDHPEEAERFYRKKLGEEQYDKLNNAPPLYGYSLMWLEDKRDELKQQLERLRK